MVSASAGGTSSVTVLPAFAILRGPAARSAAASALPELESTRAFCVITCVVKALSTMCVSTTSTRVPGRFIIGGFMQSRFGRSPFRLGGGAARPRLAFAASAGLALSLLVVLLVLLDQSAAGSVNPNPAPPPFDQQAGTVQLPAARKLIRAGEPIPVDALTEVYWPRRAAPADAVLETDELKGKFVKVDIQPLELVRRAQLSTEGRGGRIFPTLDPKMRAVTVELDHDKGSEFYKPGDWVDVVVTSPAGSEILIQRVQVLSSWGETQESGRPVGRVKSMAQSATVTLEVTPQDGVRINYAKTTGVLSLMLRDPRSLDKPEVEKVGPASPSKPQPARKTEVCGYMRIDGREYQIPCKDNRPVLMPQVEEEG